MINNTQTLLKKIRDKSNPSSNTNIFSSGLGEYKQAPKKLQTYSFSDDTQDMAYATLSDGTQVARYESYLPGTDNNERLARQQTLTEKWGNGAAKLGLKTLTAVVGGTVGTLDSLMTGISEGSISEGINSGVNVWLDDLNTKLDYKLPNLYTQQEQDAGLFEQMGQANFYADKVFGGLSFMAGAIISEAIWSAATVATLGGTSELLALNTAKQVANAAKWSEKALGGKEAVFKVLDKAKSWAKKPVSGMLDNPTDLEVGVLKTITDAEKQSSILKYKIGKGADIIVPMVRSSLYEGSMESRLYMEQTEEAWLKNYQDKNGKSPSPEEYAEFKDKLTDTGNAVMFANVGILSLSNYAQFGNAILGKTTARTIKNNTFNDKLFGVGFKRVVDGAEKTTLKAVEATKGQKIFGRVYGLGKGFVTESQEEMGQSVITGTAENYLIAGYDKDKIKSTYGLAESFGDALAKTYTSKEGLTEGLVGGIIGVLGGSAGGVKNKLRGDSFFEIDNERKEVSDAVDYSNQITTEMHINNVVANAKMQFAQELKDDSVRRNDIPGEVLADSQKTMARFERDGRIGGIEEGKKDFSRQVMNLDPDYLVEELGLENKEEAEQYKIYLIEENNNLADSYTRNLEYSRALLGEKDFQGRKDINARTISDLHSAMAFNLTMGEKAKDVNFDISAAINNEIVSLTGVQGITDAINTQNVLELADAQKTQKIKELKVQRVNIQNQLKTLQTSLLKAGKLKDKEGATTRRDAILDLTEKIQKLEEELQINTENREIAREALGVSQYTEGDITSDILDRQEENVEKFNTFMKDLAQRNPQKYTKIIGLLNQQDKAIKHIKNYEKSIQAISNKTTRLKTINNWVADIFKRNGNLVADQKKYFLDILNNFDNNMKVVENENYENLQREAFLRKESVDPQFIEILKSRDESELTETDKKILGIEPEFATIEVPNQVQELEKERDEKIANLKVKQLEVEKLRAQEQIELKEALPNAELKSDGKIDVEKLSTEDTAIYDNIYARYDKLITPILKDINKQTVEKIRAEYAKKIADLNPQSDNILSPIEALKAKIRSLTSGANISQYIGEVPQEQAKTKPSEADVKEYEDLLSKWNRKSESKLTRILERPSNYKYQDLGLSEAEIDRVKELNIILGEWMSYVGTSAGNNESIADLIERVQALELKQDQDNTQKVVSIKGYEAILDLSDEEISAENNPSMRGASSPLQALIKYDKKNKNYIFSHTSAKLFSTYLNGVSSLQTLFEVGKELGFVVTLLDGRTINATKTSRNYQVSEKDWDSVKNDLNILTVNFGNSYTAINQLLGVDSDNKEQYGIVKGDATYLQTNGSNLEIDEEELNSTKKGDNLQLRVSTTDKWNFENPEAIESYHIYIYKKDKLIASVPANYTDSDNKIAEKVEGLGLPLLQLRKNAKEFVDKQVAEGKSGLITLPYTLESTMTLIGQPNLKLEKDVEGNVTTKQNIFTKESLQLVRGTGYIIDGEIISNSTVNVKQFITKISKNNKSIKIPFVIFDYQGKQVAFPIDLIQKATPQDQELREMFSNAEITNTVKIKFLIDTLSTNGIDPNQFGINYSNTEDFTTQTEEIELALSALSRVQVNVNLDNFAKKTYKIENLPNDATIALDIERTPFLSSKLLIKLSDKIATDVLGYNEFLAQTEKKRFEAKTALNEVIKDINFQYSKNLALGLLDNNFITTFDENPLVEGTADILITRNINNLKIAIKGISKKTKGLIGNNLIEDAKNIIKEINFFENQVRNIKQQIKDSRYYSEVEEDFITVNSDGELNNPHILEAQLIEELGGIKDENEFNSTLQNSNFKLGQLNLFEDLSQFNKVKVLNENFEEVVKEDIAETIKATLQEDENNVVRDAINSLEGLSNIVWQNNPQQIKTLLRNIKNKAINISLDLEGLENSYDTKSQVEIMAMLRSLDFLLNNVTEENQNYFIETYEQFMDVTKQPDVRVVKVDEKFRDKPLRFLETKSSDYKVFKEKGLLKIADRVFLKTDSTRMALKDIEILMQANKMEISKDEMDEQIADVYTNDAEYDVDEVKKYLNYKKYFGAKTIKTENKVVSQNAISNIGYLKTDFIADIYKEYLLNKDDVVLRNLVFNEKGITLKYTDEISIAEMNQYLETNEDLKNYFIISKNTNFDIVSDNIEEVSERDMLINGNTLEEFKGDFRKINAETFQLKTNENFVTINQENFERVDGDFFVKLRVNESGFYELNNEAPILTINPSDYTIVMNEGKVQLKNKYSKDEGENIDKSIDCSK